MKRNLQQHPLEIRLAKIANGFRSIEDRTYGLVFKEGKLLADEVVPRIQRGLDAFLKARQLEAEAELARQVRDGLRPEMKRLCDEALVVAKRHYGGDAEKMATFGVEKPAPSKPRAAKAEAKRRRQGGPSRGDETVQEVVMTVVEEVTVRREEPCCEAPTSRREEPKVMWRTARSPAPAGKPSHLSPARLWSSTPRSAGHVRSGPNAQRRRAGAGGP